MNKRNIEVALQCFVKKDGKYLMLRRYSDKKIMPGVWMAPGGRHEFWEGLYEAAERKIKNETGLGIKNIQVKAVGVGCTEDINLEIYLHFLTADYKDGDLLGKSDAGELVWLTLNEIKNLDNLLVELKELLPYIFTNNREIVSFKAKYKQGNELIDFVLEDPK